MSLKVNFLKKSVIVPIPAEGTEVQVRKHSDNATPKMPV